MWGSRFSGIADRDALHLPLRFWALGQSHGQHSVSERRFHPFRIQVGSDLQRTLEFSMPPFTVVSTVALRLLLALEGQHAIMQRQVYVVLLHAGKLSYNLHFLLCLDHLDMRPRSRCAEASRNRNAEPAGEIIEEPVHIA